ncbi:hypothetical protein [Allokutzneria sp. NRRL B-24872]|uniref:hypothetical protein n=1 Tax=Allokutzneria sp. NRRL B-24872 TaxID=1137961 RepID=UPI000A39508A|nr:hypothetical protein [Allokutzneria sp. NRRL B-24872]
MSSGRLFRSLAVLLCGFTLIATGPTALAATPPPVSPFTVFDYYHLPGSDKIGWSPVESAVSYHVLVVKTGQPTTTFRTVKATDEQFVEILVGKKFSPDRAAPNTAYDLRVQAEYAGGQRSALSGEPVVYTEALDTGSLLERRGA